MKVRRSQTLDTYFVQTIMNAWFRLNVQMKTTVILVSICSGDIIMHFFIELVYIFISGAFLFII